MRSSSQRLHEWPCRNIEADNQSGSKRKVRCQSKVFQQTHDIAILRFSFAKKSGLKSEIEIFRQHKANTPLHCGRFCSNSEKLSRGGTACASCGMKSRHVNRSDKTGHSQNRRAQKWPSASVLMLVHNNDHPHPWVDTAFPAGHSQRERRASSSRPSFCVASLYKLIRRTLRLRCQ